MDLERFRRKPLMGILRGVTPDQLAATLASAAAGGLETLEITMNTAGAAGLIERARAKAPADLEKSLGELEKIVESLEGGELPLDKALEQFERGVGLSRECQKALAEAEQRVQILSGDDLAPYDAGESAD